VRFLCSLWAYVAPALCLLPGYLALERASTHEINSPVPVIDEPITPVPPSPAFDPKKIALGEQLFRDVRLSRQGTHGCATCHDPGSNGSTQHTAGIIRSQAGHNFDVPTVFNAALSFRLSWEGKYHSLEEQAAASMVSHSTMDSSVEESVARLSRDPVATQGFKAAYGHDPDAESLLNAIATYERSLITPGSRFDRWLAGDASALTPKELAGYRLFKSLGCVSCHQGVNIGGNLFQRHGVFRPLGRREPVMLRVPSLRNVAETAPYFHDGSAPTLEDAVRKMGAAQLNFNLSDEQISTIVAFLQTLTGNYRGRRVGELN
jgi:cytochrome c peroxidase